MVTSTYKFYSLYNVNGVACFYHGTRLLLADGFSKMDIKPFKIDTEFSSSPAFYATNSVTAAFEFPLHNRLSMNPEDTVVVFCFELNLRVLHGDIPAPSGETFKVHWFEVGVEDEAWEEFCSYNLYGPDPKHQHPYDIVIGAICYPSRQNHSVSPRAIEGLMQVAFCSKAVWTWAGSCVQRLFIENRLEEV
jgi:hypothetical protein